MGFSISIACCYISGHEGAGVEWISGRYRLMQWLNMSSETTIPTLQDRIRLLCIQTFFKNADGNPVSLMGAGVLSAMIMYGIGAPKMQLFAWLVLHFSVCLAIFFFQQHVKRVGISRENAECFFLIRAYLGYAVCGLFGALVLFLLGRPAGLAHVFVFMITTTLVMVGYMTYATMFRYCLMVNALAFLPFVVYCIYRYVATGEQFFLLMIASSAVWQAIVGSKALQLTRSVVGEIEARERLHDEMAERKAAEEALRESQDRSQRLAIMLRLICDNVPDLLWAKDLENRYIFVNAALCERFFGCSSTEEPIGKTFDDYVQRERERHLDDPEWFTYGQYSQDIDRHTISRDEATTFEEAGNVRGKFVHFDVHQSRFVNAQGELIGTVGCARDITERKTVEMQVQHLAHHDVLTDLPNRVLLSARMEQSLALARRERSMLALLFIDLDRLKPVNDALGHDAGDLLLKEVASRLQAVLVRETDTAARFGGDEFVVLLPRINKRQDAAVVAERIRNALDRPFAIDQRVVDISASIGVAVFPYDGEDVESLLRNADAAMYRVKNAGRNGFRFFAEAADMGDLEQIAI